MRMISETNSRAALKRPAQRLEWARWLSLCLTRSTERRALKALDDVQLKDIGLSRADVSRECRRWPWDGGVRRP